MKVGIEKKYLVLLAFCVALLPISLVAQLKFTATISPKVIGKNDVAELNLMVENAKTVQQIIPPQLKDFDIILGPVQKSRILDDNGITKIYTGISFRIKPKKQGNFTIGPATAKADGQTLQSNTTTLQVTNSSVVNNQPTNPPSPLSNFFQPPPQPQREITSYDDIVLKKNENIQEKINKNVFVKAEVNKNSCYIGEPVTITYKLYTRLKGEWNISKNPSFNGCSVIDLISPGNNSYDIEKVGGREYNVFTLRSSQLYPLEAGEMELESAAVDNNIYFIKEDFAKANKSIFMGRFKISDLPSNALVMERVTLNSKPVTINVKPFPETVKPTSFKGAVGLFTMNVSVDKTDFTTDDAGRLKIEISGEGNMMLINVPDINWSDSIDAFEAKTSEQLNRVSVPVSGSKYFEYPFTVSSAGSYTLPSVEFSFFDTRSGNYKTVHSEPIQITVTKGTGRSVDSLIALPSKSNKEQFFDRLFNNRLMIIIPVALLIICGLIVWIRKDNKQQALSKKNKEEEEDIPLIVEEKSIIPLNPLASSQEKLLLHDNGFYSELNKEFRKFLSKQLNIPLEEINKKRIAEEADKKGIAVSTTLQIQQLLDDIEWQLYTPFSGDDAMQDMYERANVLVSIIAKNGMN